MSDDVPSCELECRLIADASVHSLGGLAFVVGALVLLWLADSPSTARFLTEREKLIALERIRANQSGTISHRFKKAQAVEAIRDFKVWWLLFLMACISVPNSCITSFTSILVSLAFSFVGTQKVDDCRLSVVVRSNLSATPRRRLSFSTFLLE